LTKTKTNTKTRSVSIHEKIRGQFMFEKDGACPVSTDYPPRWIVPTIMNYELRITH